MPSTPTQWNVPLRDVYRTIREAAQEFVNSMPDPDEVEFIDFRSRLDAFSGWCSQSRDAASKAIGAHDQMIQATIEADNAARAARSA